MQKREQTTKVVTDGKRILKPADLNLHSFLQQNKGEISDIFCSFICVFALPYDSRTHIFS